MQNFRLLIAHKKFHQICTLIAPFVESIFDLSLNNTGELCLMALKSDTNLNKNLFVDSKLARI